MSAPRPTGSAAPLRVVPLTPELLGTWAALFEAAACPCHCRYWHFTGTKNEWLERSAMSPETSRDEHARATHAGEDEARGLVALARAGDHERAVGWMKLTPRRAVAKLRSLSVYRAHDLGDDDGIYAVGCFLVHPEHRRQRVARALLEAAPEVVRAWGGRALEAYPREASTPLSDEEAFLGPVALFRELGFREVAGESPYPVLRRVL